MKSAGCCLPIPSLLLLLLSFMNPAAANAAEAGGADQSERGRKIYAQICWVCHQSSGQGLPNVFPPLAGADYLLEDKERSVGALLLGLNEKITVNGRTYQGVMPPSGLGDDQIADVLTYVRSAWGNSGDAVSVAEVRRLRARLALEGKKVGDATAPFPPLPTSPAGLVLREVAQLPEQPVRMGVDGDSKRVYVLSVQGHIWGLNWETGELQPVLRGESYIDPKRGDPNSVGLAFDRQKRLYLVVNQRDESGVIVTNQVTIFRTDGPIVVGQQVTPKPWFQTHYPWGIGPFNHGVGHVALGPDGNLYVASGSRTDGSEPGENPRYWKGGEHELTACIWRLDPTLEKPTVEIYARGLRNSYGFCWNDRGEMLATDNGPDADVPEELNVIERGRHYGFPYQYSDWNRKPYAYTPDVPAGVAFTRPVINRGPDGGVEGRTISTFDPHSSPAGICFLGEGFPAAYRGGFLVTRFGNLLSRPKDVGFDVLLVRIEPAVGSSRSASVKSLLAALGRPIDVIVAAPGKVLVAEYSRATGNSGAGGMLPGRILELSVAP
ncbi:MAG: PQQ-dependent sugar dehydrogenase [Opitutaceae bacterium]|nr:PQQ-dependent sugar dehydrogenase [Verrucomicrobiales bacterium]